MIVREEVELGPLTTLRVGGPARWLVEAEDERDVCEAFQKAKAEGLPFEVIGGGSNLLVADAGYPGMILRMGLRGIWQTGDVFDVAAGEPWDGFVDQTIAAGYGGVDCLAGIPGSVGASPVQNIGAYGQEVAQTIASVRALDRQTGDFVELSAEECGFRYRRSVFNTEQKSRYLITRVRFQLRAGARPHLGYADLQRWFAGREDLPTLEETATAVRAIRRSKGMVLIEGDPDTWSAGSYFKNPVVAAPVVERVAAAEGIPPDAVPKWPAGEGQVKLSAAWLLERAGFGKGFRLGPAGLSTKHALALTNRGGASCADLLRLESTIRAGVEQRFGVSLEREPVMLG